MHAVLDRRYRELHAQGVGTTKQQSEILSCSEEEQLWDTETLGVDSPLALQYAVFFYNGLNFVLRGGQEHRELKISQLNFKSIPDPKHPGEDTECVEYYEHGSINRPGGRHQLNLANKVVVYYSRPELGT